MKKLNLTPEAYTLLLNLVSSSGWAKALSDIYSGGKFLVSNQPSKSHDPVSIEVSDKELECIKKAINFHVTAGNIPASIYIVELFDQLGIQT